MRALAFACALAAACGPRAAPPAATLTGAGLSISIYRERTSDVGYAIVDDRRWIEVHGSTVLLPNIDPGAALASLSFETRDRTVQIGPCTRERLPGGRTETSRRETDAEYGRRVERTSRVRSRGREVPVMTFTHVDERYMPVVQCAASGPPGRHLVRIVYVSTSLAYRPQHDVELRDRTTTIDSRYAIATPAWHERAEVVLFDGVPGAAEPPREIARGPLTLDGGTGVLVTPTRTVAGQLRYIASGGTSEEASYAAAADVWATLELRDITLPRGNVRVHTVIGDDEHWIDVASAEPSQGDDDDEATADDDDRDVAEPLRVRLWPEPSLRGQRERVVVENDGSRVVEVVVLVVTNHGDVSRDVVIEERARRAKKRRIERAWPSPPAARGDLVRSKLTVKPGRAERAGYSIVYEL